MGRPRRAARVEDRREEVEVERVGLGVGLGRGEQVVVGLELLRLSQRRELWRSCRGRNAPDPLLFAAARDHNRGCAVAEDELELRYGEPPIERDERVAAADARRLDLEVLELVGREQRDTVAGTDAASAQRGAEAPDAVVDLREREATAVADCRGSPGEAAGALGDEIDVTLHALRRRLSSSPR